MKKTNEQLAQLIQNGEKHLIPELWNKVQSLLYMRSEQIYNANSARFTRCGVELWDVKQAAYLAFLDAVKAYKPDSGFKFTAYLNYPLRNAINSLTGSRTAKTLNEPLNHSTSLDKPLDDAETDGDTLLDTVADDSALEFVNELEAVDDGLIVRSVVDALPDKLRLVTKMYFFEGATLSDIAVQLDVSPEYVRQLKAKALRRLRKNEILKNMWGSLRRHQTAGHFSEFWTSPEILFILKT